MGPKAEAQSPVFEAVKASRRTFIGLAVFSFFISLLMLTGPLYMLQVYDRVLASASVPTLVALTVLVVVLYSTMGALDWCRQALFSVAASQIEDRLAEPALVSTLKQNLYDPGRTSEQSLRDLRTLRRFIASPTLPALFDFPYTPLFFLVLFMLHWAFGLWALFGGAVLLTLALANQVLSRKAIRAAEMEEQRSNARASELVRHVQVVEALGMKDRMIARWRHQFDTSDTALRSSGETLGGFTAATKAFRMLMQSGILGLGAWLAIMGHASHGSMVAASILMGRAIGPIEQLVGQWRSLVQARTSWGNLTKTITASAPGPEPMALPPIRGAVELQAVTAGPPGSRTPVLRNVSFRLNPGDCLGVIGPSASGKSTLARVIVGIWRPMAGIVRLDGADLATLDRVKIGPQIGYLPQQVDLFAGSVKDNISRFNSDAASEAVIAAAEAAGCHQMILRLPNGYDTEIGESGAYLSAGQRQRIGLARALYGATNLIILDEPNANLDAEGDTALQNALAGAKLRGATSIVIAHRPSAIAACNKLLVLDSGQIRMFGPKEEVLAKLQEDAKPPPTASVTPIRKESQNG